MINKKNLFYTIVLVLVLIVCVVACNKNFEKGMEDCKKNNSVDYCRSALAR